MCFVYQRKRKSETCCQMAMFTIWSAIVLFCCQTLCAGEASHYASSHVPESSRTETNFVHNASSTSRAALLMIFKKYGQNDSLSFEGFEHLLESLGLGNIAVCNHSESEHQKRSIPHQHHNYTENSHRHGNEFRVEGNNETHHSNGSVCTDCLSSRVDYCYCIYNQ